MDLHSSRPLLMLAPCLALSLSGCINPGSTAATTTTTTTATGFKLVDTGQNSCFDEAGAAIACPASGSSLYGQDAQYAGNAPSYTDNGDGTITDNNTGLMWLQSPDLNGDGVIDSGDKLGWAAAVSGASSFSYAGYGDWRLPSIKELYSLMNFSGSTGMGDYYAAPPANAAPYIDTTYFDFGYGDYAAGERYIDARFWSSTEYVSTTMNGDATVFGVNFADGRIKGYPRIKPSGVVNTAYVRYVRGNSYGANKLVDNGDKTISDQATGLMWMQDDSGSLAAGGNGDGGLNWQEALAWCGSLDYAGYADWRLPNAKELQSIVDYSRSPATTSSAAIDPLFTATPVVDEGGNNNWAFYWTGTSHQDGQNFAVYIAFGEALGCMNSVVMDVHGAGSQRSDPKNATGVTLGCGFGPQGDVIRVANFARCVRGG